MSRGLGDVYKRQALTRILETEDYDGVIIFVRTRVATQEIADKLSARGYATAALNGDIAQAQRERTVDNLKRGKLDILVATDVAARGLDVERISHVVNYDIPNDPEAYVHRIGRTGRAGRSGEAILFAANRERRLLRTIERVTGQKIEAMQLPTSEQVSDKRAARFKARITETLDTQELDAARRIVDSYQQEFGVPVIEIAAALVKMNQTDGPAPLPIEPSPASHTAGKPDRERKPSRKERAKKPRPATDKEERNAEPGMQRYRVEVGHQHGVKPGNIVGAIANEAEIDSEYIGRIEINDDHSLVDLPEGMPKEIFKHLKSVWVSGQKLRISVADAKPKRPKPPKQAKARKPADAGAKTPGAESGKGPRKRKARPAN